MDTRSARRESEPTLMKNHTTVERKSERELVVTRTFNAPARLVFEAWTKPSCSGSGGCRSRWECPCFPAKWMFVSGAGTVWSSHTGLTVGVLRHVQGSNTALAPRLTNEESDEGSVTTVTFAEKGGKTLLVMHELYPSKEALDAAGTGAADAMGETFEQLDELLVTLGASVGRS